MGKAYPGAVNDVPNNAFTWSTKNTSYLNVAIKDRLNTTVKTTPALAHLVPRCFSIKIEFAQSTADERISNTIQIGSPQA